MEAAVMELVATAAAVREAACLEWEEQAVAATVVAATAVAATVAAATVAAATGAAATVAAARERGAERRRWSDSPRSASCWRRCRERTACRSARG